MNTKDIIEIIAALRPLVCVLAMVRHRIKRDQGMGIRALQFVAIVSIPPAILILALEGKLEGAAGALIGGLAGYMLSSVSEYDKAPTQGE